MGIINKFKLLKQGTELFDKSTLYRVDTVVYDTETTELAVSFIRIQTDTGENDKFVESIFFKGKEKKAEPTPPAKDVTVEDIAVKDEVVLGDITTPTPPPSRLKKNRRKKTST